MMHFRCTCPKCGGWKPAKYWWQQDWPSQGKFYPRTPLKWESESRAAGTGLIPGRQWKHPNRPVYPHPPFPPWERGWQHRPC